MSHPNQPDAAAVGSHLGPFADTNERRHAAVPAVELTGILGPRAGDLLPVLPPPPPLGRVFPSGFPGAASGGGGEGGETSLTPEREW